MERAASLAYGRSRPISVYKGSPHSRAGPGCRPPGEDDFLDIWDNDGTGRYVYPQNRLLCQLRKKSILSWFCLLLLNEDLFRSRHLVEGLGVLMHFFQHIKGSCYFVYVYTGY